jgi:hypothetical protein
MCLYKIGPKCYVRARHDSLKAVAERREKIRRNRTAIITCMPFVSELTRSLSPSSSGYSQRKGDEERCENGRLYEPLFLIYDLGAVFGDGVPLTRIQSLFVLPPYLGWKLAFLKPPSHASPKFSARIECDNRLVISTYQRRGFFKTLRL